MERQEVRVGMAGYKFMGKAHSHAYRDLELMNALQQRRRPAPDFNDGVKCQEVLEAVDLSIAERRWVKTSEV